MTTQLCHRRIKSLRIWRRLISNVFTPSLPLQKYIYHPQFPKQILTKGQIDCCLYQKTTKVINKGILLLKTPTSSWVLRNKLDSYKSHIDCRGRISVQHCTFSFTVCFGGKEELQKDILVIFIIKQKIP